MVKSKTIVLLAIALVSAVGLYVWDKNRPDTSTTAEKSASTPLFAIKEADITAVQIQAQRNSVDLRRRDKWQIVSPKPGPADDATVAFLLNLLATGKSERSLTAEASNLKEFGLEQPVATVTFELQNRQTHKLRLGAQTFDQSSIYATVDTPSPQSNISASKVPIVLLPTSFLNGVNRPLSDWQAKPKASVKPLVTPSVTPPAAPSSSKPSGMQPTSSPSASP